MNPRWRIYYDKPTSVSSLWAWIFSTWNILEKKYYRDGKVVELVGSHQEEGMRIFGVCFVWFKNAEAEKYYEDSCKFI